MNEENKTPSQELVKFLCDGTRYKVGFIEGVGTVITGLPENLEGEWVALVEATDNCHMKLTTHPIDAAAQIAQLTDALEQLLEYHLMLGNSDQSSKVAEARAAIDHTKGKQQ